MGGATTEISDSTTEVLLEMAWWDPPSISRTVKRLNLPSEASTRFRRGADWGDNIDRAMRRFIQLAAESGITAVSGFVDVAGTTLIARRFRFGSRRSTVCSAPNSPPTTWPLT